MSEPPVPSSSVDALFSRWDAARQHGQTIAPEELCRDCPQLLAELQGRIDGLQAMERFVAKGQAGGESADSARASTLNEGSISAKAMDTSGIVVPGYEIIEELGRGGMGVVFKARHLRLKRIVALKMILQGDFASREQRARFQSEAEAVARLHHPSIVQIHEIGEHQGLPFFTLEFCAGGSLAKKLSASQLIPGEAARCVEKLARAVHAAHKQDVVHRDLKPANILFTEDNEPKITDFGLAKRLDEVGQTQSGAVMGTPSYMAPEQAEGKTRDHGPSVDVYALGAILYELLTGQPPFRAATTIETIQQVIRDEPIAPTRLRPKVPRDLETICLKALAKDPQQRYASALMLAQDLERFLNDEPILARREGAIRKLWRKVRRRKLAVASVLLVAATTVVAVWAWDAVGTSGRRYEVTRRFEAALDGTTWTAQEKSQLVSLTEEIAGLDAAEGETARKRLHDALARHVREQLRQPRLTDGEITRLDSELRWLRERDPMVAETLAQELRQRRQTLQTLFDLKAPFADKDAVFGPGTVRVEGNALATSSKAPLVSTRVVSPNNISVEAVFAEGWQGAQEVGIHLDATPAHNGYVTGMAFTPDGKILATVAEHAAPARLWDVSTGRNRGTLGDADENAFSVACAPNGTTLATGAGAGVKLWDAATAKLLGALSGHKASVNQIAFSADGSRLASSSWSDRTVKVWDLKTRTELAHLKDFKNLAHVMRFEPDGQHLITISHPDCIVTTWDIAKGKALASYQLGTGPPSHLPAFSGDGRRIAWASGEGNQICDARSGKLETTLPNMPPCFLTFSPDSQMLAAGQSYGIHLWGIGARKFEFGKSIILDPSAQVAAMTFSPTGEWLAAGLRGSVAIWDLRRHRLHRLLGESGYAFLLSAEQPKINKAENAQATAPAKLLSFKDAGGKATLRIVRDGVVQRELPVQVSGPKRFGHLPQDTLRLLASRQGEKLTLRMNDDEPLVFFDLTSARRNDGNIALSWPEGVRLSHAQARASLLPPAPSPLEKADEALQQGRFQDALALYQEQALRAASSEVGVEARYKIAVCTQNLQREEESAGLYEAVMQDKGERWPVLAACQLWLIRLRQEKLEDAEAVLASLKGRQGVRELATYIPGDLRHRLFFFVQNTTAMELVRADENVVRRLELLSSLAELLQDPRGVFTKVRLVPALAFMGQEKRALALCTQILAANPADMDAARWYAWLMQGQGKSLEALERIDKAIDLTGPQSEDLSEHSVGLMARAHLLASLNRWDEVESTLESFKRVTQRSANSYYRVYGNAWLMAGFCRERRGDHFGAMQAWKQGSYKSFVKSLPELVRWASPDIPQTSAFLMHSILSSLSGDLSEAEAERMFQSLLASFGAESWLSQGAALVRFSPGVFRTMWQSPRGKEYARKIAFMELSYGDYVRAPLVVTAAEKLNQDLFQGKAGREQEDVIWSCIDLGLRRFYEGKLDRTQALQLALAWKGTTNFLGWGGVAPKLEPALRAQAAYILGHRYLTLNRRADALMFFRTAVKDAAPESTLRRLAQQEIERSDKMKQRPKN